MKQIPGVIKFLPLLAIVLFAAGCAAVVENKVNLVTTAGFKQITPKSPDQQAILAKLSPDEVSRITYKGKIYYVLPDAKNNVAYVGGQNEYQAYRQLRQQQQLTNENFDDASLNDDPHWSQWGGWGYTGPPGTGY